MVEIRWKYNWDVSRCFIFWSKRNWKNVMHIFDWTGLNYPLVSIKRNPIVPLYLGTMTETGICYSKYAQTLEGGEQKIRWRYGASSRNDFGELKAKRIETYSTCVWWTWWTSPFWPPCGPAAIYGNTKWPNTGGTCLGFFGYYHDPHPWSASLIHKNG